MKVHDPDSRGRARDLRAEGLTYKQIAEETGISQATIYRWLNPDYAERQRAVSRKWKETNKGACVDCGAPTNASRGLHAHERCSTCAIEFAKAEARWNTPEKCAAAMREWNDRLGRTPTGTEWRCAGENHPATWTVLRSAGSWNACLRLAGLPVHHESRTVQHVTNEQLAAMYLSGLDTVQIAEQVGGTASNVAQRLRRHGVTLRSASAARSLSWARRRGEQVAA
jgi:DNA-binding CsgD family transcriptional regulator